MEEQKVVEVVEEKKSWFKNKKDQFVAFCKDHPEGVLTVIGGLFGLAGAAMNIYAVQNEYKDNVYMSDGDQIYKVPAKEMNSRKVHTVK